jgi:hypothetical protein
MARTRSSKSTSGKKTTVPKGKQNDPQPMRTPKTISPDSVEEVIAIGYDESSSTAGPSARLAKDESARSETENLSGITEMQSGESEERRLHHRIAERAFLLYLEGGCRHGNDLEHWFEAEREIGKQQV